MNIFIAITQTHLNNFEKLMKHKLVPSINNVLVVDNTIKYNTEVWTNVIKANRSFNNTAKSKLQQLILIYKKAKAYRKILNKLKVYNQESPTVYLAYIEDILSNYMFFSFHKNTKVVVVEDGTLNYYNHTLDNINDLKFKLKQKIASVFKISFKEYEGHSSGAAYAHVIKQFVTLPEFAFIQKNVAQLPITTQSVALLNEQSLFIIGQEAYGTLLGQQKFIEALLASFGTIKKQPFYNSLSTIYYKPHKIGAQLEDGFIKKQFPDKKVVIVSTDYTAEVYYFNELRAKYIASFNSSTLINIYTALAENDKKRVGFYVYPVTIDELTPLFKRMNFTFLNTNK